MIFVGERPQGPRRRCQRASGSRPRAARYPTRLRADGVFLRFTRSQRSQRRPENSPRRALSEGCFLRYLDWLRVYSDWTRPRVATFANDAASRPLGRKSIARHKKKGWFKHQRHAPSEPQLGHRFFDGLNRFGHRVGGCTCRFGFGFDTLCPHRRFLSANLAFHLFDAAYAA